MCRQAHVDLIVVVEQLELATIIIAEKCNSLNFARRGPVDSHMRTLLRAADVALQFLAEKDKTPCDKSVCDVFTRLQQQQCIPIATLTDAGGELPADMSPIQMVKPSQCFVRLPAAARAQSSLPMYELDRADASALWSAAALWSHLHPLLGIRDLPTMDDWANCTRIIAKAILKSGIGRAEVGDDAEAKGQVAEVKTDEDRFAPSAPLSPLDAVKKEQTALLKEKIASVANAIAATNSHSYAVATPGELAAIQVAVHQMLSCESSTEGPVAVWLPNSKGQVAPANRLVWLDRPEFTDRCSNVSFVASDLLKSNPKWLDLCSRTELSKLSEIVVEVLTTKNPVQPTEAELCLEQLLRSDEFAEGYAQLVQGYGDASEVASAALERKVHQALKTVDVQWSSRIETCLKLKGASDDAVGNGERATTQKSVFSNGNGQLWLQSGLLQSHASVVDEMLSELGGRVLPKVVLMFAGAVQDTHIVINMLKEWREGPAEIANVLKKAGIGKGHRGGMQDMMRPGRVIPADLHEAVKGRFSLPLQPGDIVAVCLDAASATYKYARVEVNQAAARVAASLTPIARNCNSDNILTRVYMLDEGEKAPVERKRLEIFNITRDDNVSSAVPVAGSMVSASGSAAAREVPHEMASEEWKGLVKQLRDMVALSGGDYKTVLKQLWLQWHPDKNKRECSAAVFRLITRHSQCYRSDEKDFAWLDQLAGPETLEDAAQATKLPTPDRQAQPTPASPCVPQPSYFAEFEREEAARAVARQKEEVRRNTATSLWQHSGTNSGAGAADTDPRPPCDDHMADRYWRLAERELEVAAVLEKAEHWAPSVVHAQQAVELTVKSLMFRTCGITTFEHKGRGAHDLVALLRRLLPDRSTWPADFAAVQALSDSYIEARYGPTAVDGYTKSNAELARSTARAVVDWAKCKDWVSAPTTDSDVADLRLPARTKGPVAFDPVPPPPPPSQLPIDKATPLVVPSVVQPPPPAPVEAAAAVRRVALPDVQLEIE
jgi:HEPN domain-containing protein